MQTCADCGQPTVISPCPHCGGERLQDPRFRLALRDWLALAVVVTLAVGLFLMARKTVSERQLAGCEHNLRNLRTALETYATDNRGLYPPVMKDLVPKYLKSLPECPAAGTDTYSDTYLCSGDGHEYTVVCHGSNHALAGVQPDLPGMSSLHGFVEDR